ncbi:hypothetical protein [Pseudomonas sp. MOIL14HWK12:I2]|uniref:hypothetical protein n=1 Tax=Pseudomonas sp. MOIL14HWK12:I2 TaxID=1033994 RepID=UPI00048A37B4|nr:hypothetical protein [Pseudomonas sp. MOIL14HWK12:I2]
MMKFAKFKKLLNEQEAMSYLSELAQEELSERTFESLISDEYLNPIVGSNDILVGFTSDEAEKLMDGDDGQVSVISYIGVPAVSDTAYALGEETFKFAIACDIGRDYYFFAKVARDVVSGERRVRRRYDITQLESLDPFSRENQAFLTYELKRIADIANDPAKPAIIEDISNRVLVYESLLNLLYVTEICGIPGGYHADNRMGAHMHQQKEPEGDRPSNKLLIGALLDIITDSKPRRMNQEALAMEIEERFKGVRGLGPTTTKTIFAEANKLLREVRKAAI